MRFSLVFIGIDDALFLDNTNICIILSGNMNWLKLIRIECGKVEK